MPTDRNAARQKNLRQRVVRLGTEQGAQEAVNAITARMAVRNVPVKGFDDVLNNPRSLRSWARALTRTGIAAGLTYVAPGVGNWAEEALHRIGYKRMAIAAAILSVMSTLVVVAVLVSAAAAVESVLKPASVVASVLGHIPGFGPDDGSEEEAVLSIGKVCGPVPDTAPVTVSEHGEGEASEDGTPPPSFQPEPVIDSATGKATPRVHDALQLIPSGSIPLVAESWLMYYLSHPDNDVNREWGSFVAAYEGAYAYVVSQREEGSLVDENGSRLDITPLEIVMAIDPDPTYTPFQLVSSAAVFTLGIEGHLPMTEAQAMVLKGRTYSACGI